MGNSFEKTGKKGTCFFGPGELEFPIFEIELVHHFQIVEQRPQIIRRNIRPFLRGTDARFDVTSGHNSPQIEWMGVDGLYVSDVLVESGEVDMSLSGLATPFIKTTDNVGEELGLGEVEENLHVGGGVGNELVRRPWRSETSE